MAMPIKTVTGSYTFTVDDYTILVNNSTTVTVYLPTAACAPGRTYCVQKLARHNSDIIIDPSGNELIDGASTLIFSSKNTGYIMQSDGSNWWIINR